MKRFLFALAFTFVVSSFPSAWAAPASVPTTSRDFLERAGNLVAAGNFSAALEDYGEAIRLRLDDPDAWLGRGKALTAVGRFRDGIDDFDQAIRLRPQFIGAYLERGFAYGQAGDFARGIQDLSRVLAAEPSNARALMLRGDAHVRLEHFDQAIDDFSAALEASSDAGVAANRVRLLLARSHVYALLGRHQAALQDRNEAVLLAPRNPEVYVARGGSLHEIGLHEQGLADRTEAIRLKPDFADAWYARGSAQFLLGDYRKASQDLQEALRLKPDYADARGVLEKAQKEIAKETLGLKPAPSIAAASSRVPAVNTNVLADPRPSSLQVAAKLPPQAPISEGSSPAASKADSSKGESSGEESAAAALPVPASRPAAFTKTAASEPAVTIAKIEPRPAAKVAPAAAIPTPTAVVSTTPAAKTTPTPVSEATTDSRSAAAHNQRGRDLIQQGKVREAVDELTAALNARPEFTLALNARGFAYVLLREWPRATTDLDAAIRLDPRYANAYQNRAFARKGAGDSAGATADQAKFQELTAKK